MSVTDRKVSRRGLLGLLKPDPATPQMAVPQMPVPQAQAAPAFSLERFYGARAPGAGTMLPTFTLRGGLSQVPTTNVGVTSPAQGASGAVDPFADGPVRAFDGVARVRPYACLAHQGSFCSVCVERCPVPGAIEVELGRPRVVEDACTGCGACIHACPAPVNGFDVAPRPEASPRGDLHER